ncbi:MAG: choice-of-anchor tandem repeat GloVer-containing protein [Candidatus Sulfotelmatobacter sp.]
MPCKRFSIASASSISISIALLVTLSTFVASPARAQTFTVLHNFPSMTGDGRQPYGSLVFDPKGNIYGTTYSGGTADSSNYGTVYALSPKGGEALLHSFFFSNAGLDGENPAAGLLRDASGNLYGTTLFAGTNNYGTVFKIDSAGTETILHDFTGGGIDGAYPGFGNLIMDSAGSLYGTTEEGGSSGNGTVYKIDSTGVETVLYSFTGENDGQFPYGSLVMDSAGNLYGTTLNGGNSRTCSSCGIVFKLTPPTSSGPWQETVLHNFAGGTGATADGQHPYAGLVLSSTGHLYGTTRDGGSAGCGTVFEMGTTGREKVLYSFAGGISDGCTPVSVLLANAGNLYGTTVNDGAFAGGIIFELSETGAETILHSFNPSTDGSGSVAGLVRGPKGALYGTTSGGGVNNFGTVFELIP